MRTQRIFVGVLTFLVLTNMVVTAQLYMGQSETSSRLNSLEEDSELLTDYLLQDTEGREVNGTVNGLDRRSSHFVAYDTASDSGTTIQYHYQPLPGDAVYVDAGEVTVEGSFQQSLRDARSAVSSTPYDPIARGMAISVTTPGEWEYVGGTSAGLPVAAQIAATDPGYEMDSSVALTGQVEAGGSVVTVDNIEEKARAAREQGYDVLIAPYSTAAINVDGIEIVHVQSVTEALDRALVPAGSQE